MNERRHHVQLVLQREMAGIEKMQFGIGEITKIGMRALGREDLVVFAPRDQRRRLAITEKGLDLRIQRHVTT